MDMRIYERLRDHLDSLPTGYPRTQSGVELKILQRLFTEDEAEMACQLRLFPETSQQVAERLKRSPEMVNELLYRMSQKGLILRIKVKDVYQYMATMYIVGIFEYQLKNMDREMAEIFDKYAHEAMYKEMSRSQTPQLRVVPVQESLVQPWKSSHLMNCGRLSNHRRPSP